MLTLTPCTEADFPLYRQLVTDARVMAYVTERALPEAEARAWFAAVLAANAKHSGLGTLVVRDGDAAIGTGKLLPTDVVGEAELGFMLLPAQWGQGYGSCIADALIELAKEHGLTRLIAIIDPANTASRRILTKRGFASEYVGMMDGLPGERLALAL